MSRNAYHKRYQGDILNAYVGLTLEERGAYDTLLELMYDRLMPIPNDIRWIAGWFGCSTRKAKAVIDVLLERGKIYRLETGEISNKRFEIEREKRANYSRTQAENASKPKSIAAETPSTVNENKEIEKPNENEASAYQKPITINHKPEATTAEDVAPAVAVGKRCAEIMGVADDPRWLGNYSTGMVWLAEGFDPELDIYPTVTAIVASMRHKKRPMPGSLKYFTNAIRERYLERRGGAIATRPVEFVTVSQGTPEHRAWLSYFKSQGRKTKFLETLKEMAVPTPWPPTEAMKQTA